MLLEAPDNVGQELIYVEWLALVLHGVAELNEIEDDRSLVSVCRVGEINVIASSEHSGPFSVEDVVST